MSDLDRMNDDLFRRLGPPDPPTLTLDEAGVERLAAVVHQVFCVEVMEEDHQLVGPWDEDRARAIVERLRGEA